MALLQGEFTVHEGQSSVQFITRDGAVDPVVTALDPIPRVGETVDLGDGAVYVVEHVRWVLVARATRISGHSTARILFAPAADPTELH